MIKKHYMHLSEKIIKENPNIGTSLDTLFGDGVAALIVGSDLDTLIERPLFQLISADQMFIPDSENAIEGHVCEMALVVNLAKNVLNLIFEYIDKCMVEALVPWVIMIGTHYFL